VFGTKKFLPPNPFRYHVKKEHNRWSYFKYILYLHEKDEDTFTGLEQYVWDLISSTNVRDQISWFPLGTALSLGGSDGKQDDNGDEENEEEEEEEGDEEEEDGDEDEGDEEDE